jgi:hypothetical protein
MNGTRRENRVGKVGNAPHHGRTENDAADDFSNDPGLADPSEYEGKYLGEADDYD